jgi:hypothetical protein
LAAFSDLQLMGILAAFAVGLVAFSLVFYRWMFHQAKERGMIDMETSY